jgi:hypothetical protein
MAEQETKSVIVTKAVHDHVAADERVEAVMLPTAGGLTLACKE